MAVRFAHPLENLLRTALSVTVTTGTPLDTYPVTKLYDGVWHGGLRIEGTDLDVEMEFAAPVAPAFAMIGNANLTVAAKLQGHTSASWGTPDVDLTFGTPSSLTSGFFTSPWLAPSVATKAFWRLHVTGNTYPISIGELFLGATARTIARAYQSRGLELPVRGSTVQYRTSANVKLAYEQATPVRLADGLVIVSGSELLTLEALVYAAKFEARPFPFVPRTAVDDAWMVTLMIDDVLRPRVIGNDLYEVALPVEMSARGLPWVDPDTL